MIDMGVDWLQTDDPAGVRFFEARRRLGAFPTMIAFHRGANRYAPENTLKSISEAARLGADYIEIDIRTTRDNQHVLMHDSQLTRTTGSAVPVNGAGLNEMRKLSAGAWFNQASAQERVPTLDEGLKALGPKAAVYLDAKAIDPVALANAIRTGDLFNRHVVYQSLEYCGKLKALEPRARLLPPLSSLDNLNTVAAIKPFGVDARWGILSSDMISQCHAKGILVFSDALGLNENIIQYRRAISWGIDCIQTDYPLRVLRAFELEAADKNRK
jgi:glycerophosphoryl diester phosphodiesterase